MSGLDILAAASEKDRIADVDAATTAGLLMALLTMIRLAAMKRVV